METEKIDVPKFEGFEAFFSSPENEKDVWILDCDGKNIRRYCGYQKGHQICYRKIKPKRIVLEETDDVRQAEYGDWYEHEGVISQWKGCKTSHEYKIWRQVEEQS